MDGANGDGEGKEVQPLGIQVRAPPPPPPPGGGGGGAEGTDDHRRVDGGGGDDGQVEELALEAALAFFSTNGQGFYNLSPQLALDGALDGAVVNAGDFADDPAPPLAPLGVHGHFNYGGGNP